MSEAGTSRRLAVLIDADNASPKAVSKLLGETIAAFGEANIKRAYRDWTGSGLTEWKETLLDHAIQPMQQFANLPRKNATDIAMIIDAMDLLYTRKLDGFCIVSSDSDFTALARRLREDGLFVLGCGEAKTHVSLRAACSQFVEIGPRKDVPTGGAVRTTTKSASKSKATKTSEQIPSRSDATKKRSQTPRSPDHALIDIIRRELKKVAKDDKGVVSLSQLGKALATNADYRNSSRNRGGLKKIVKAHQGEFQIETRDNTDYIRDARAPS